MFRAEAVEKIQTHFTFNNFFPRKPFLLCDNVEKYGQTRQATYNLTRRTPFVCWIAKNIDTHSEYVILLGFTRQHWLREGAWAFDTLPVLISEIIVGPKYFNIVVGGLAHCKE
jgi:hypothetical protein